MSIIEVNQISKSFGDLRAVDDISFKIDEGTVFGFLGPNGAGKSNVLDALMFCFCNQFA